jgi:hypothetical protein
MPLKNQAYWDLLGIGGGLGVVAGRRGVNDELLAGVEHLLEAGKHPRREGLEAEIEPGFRELEETLEFEIGRLVLSLGLHDPDGAAAGRRVLDDLHQEPPEELLARRILQGQLGEGRPDPDYGRACSRWPGGYRGR